MAASSGDPPLPNAIVPWRQTTPQCPTLPCPYCSLQVPRNASDQDICAKVRKLTNDASAQLRDVIERYMGLVTAADNIMMILESDRPLPAAPSLWTLIDSRTNESYNTMTRLLKQRVEIQAQTDSEESDDSVGAAAAAASSSGSRGTTRGTKRNGDEAEYPQWQFKGGKKKTQWQAYDKNTNQLLESAFNRGLGHLDFTIDEWDYTVNFTTRTQVSHEHGTVREVRRVEDAGHLAI